MKKVSVFLFLACIAVFSVNAAAPPLDTNVAYISPNVVDEGGWYVTQLLSTIDTTGGLILKDSTGVDIVKIKTVKQAAADPVYPYTSLECEFDTANFSGATALRITYKADQPWVVSLMDTTIDYENSGPYGQSIPVATDWTVIGLNMLDTTLTGFRQPSWINNGKNVTPINYSTMMGIAFDPYDPDDLGITASLAIKDLRIYHYNGFKSPVKFAVSKSRHSRGSIRLSQSNVLKFAVPSTNVYSVSVYSPAGKLVLRLSKPCVKDAKNEVSLKNFNFVPGIYFARISLADYSAIGKIVIK
jgi:hypothetical protein